MKLLITGTTGLVGRHLLPKLLLKDHKILELTRDIERSKALYDEKTQKVLASHPCSQITEQIKEFSPDIVIHLAAYISPKDDPDTMKRLIDSNVFFLCKVLNSIKGSETKLFINTGTFAEYYRGDDQLDPAYLYAATKIASRFFVKYYSKINNYKEVTVVPYTIYGGNEKQKKIIDIIQDSMFSTNKVDLSPGDQVLDFIHVDDVANFYVHIVENYKSIDDGSTFKLGSGSGTTLRELSNLMESITGKKTNINWGGKPYRKSDVHYAVADTRELRKVGWTHSIDLDSYIRDRIQNQHK